MITISDLNGGYGSTDYSSTVDAAVDRILALHPDLVISAGDMVAGQRRPHLSRPEVEAMWRAFHQHVSERLAAAGIPLAVTPGNHDASGYHGFEMEREIFAAQWQPRKPALTFVDDTAYPWNYAFALGDTLFIALDVTRVGELEAARKEWLQTLLDRYGGSYRHRVLFSHLPLWPLAVGRETEYSGDAELETILREENVDLYISGHQHAFYPGFKDGTNLLGLACLGSAPRRLIGTTTTGARSISLLEFRGDHIGLSALGAPEFTRSIPWQSLPARIHSSAATIERADLVQQLLREQLPPQPGAASVPGQ
ncbi:metallophosphoesterase family protein [Haliea sp. E17]|uniref:metallophosphoesterase family protein n=1 Tax=Haliea sp. E17 TaxID=3401576 RepID=UPI003AAD1576